MNILRMTKQTQSKYKQAAKNPRANFGSWIQIILDKASKGES
jgi:hypothetical protein